MLSDNAKYLISLYSSTATNDSGGGTDIDYLLEQADVPASINTVSANLRLMYAQQDIVVTDTVGILSALLTVTPKPGWKAVAQDTGKSMLYRGIRSGRESIIGIIPPLTYLDCETVL